jgi:hypothetical protein
MNATLDAGQAGSEQLKKIPGAPALKGKTEARIMTEWRAVTRSAKARPQNPALCKGFQGVQETGSDQKIGNSQANSIDIAAIEEEDFYASVGKILKRRGVGTPRR